MPKLDLIQVLIDYHRDRIQPSHYSEVQDLADLYSVTPQAVCLAMIIAQDIIENQDLKETK